MTTTNEDEEEGNVSANNTFIGAVKLRQKLNADESQKIKNKSDGGGEGVHVAGRGEARRGVARRGGARRGMARRGEARRGAARRSEAWRGEAWCVVWFGGG